jgi:ribose-phosphate pyrophosphokinase
MLIFALDTADRHLAEAIAAHLGVTLSPHEHRRFADGECKLRPLADPHGQDAYVVHGLHGGLDDSPHDKLVRLLMFIATLRDHGARRVTAVLPYLAYARKDRRTKPYDPLSLRYVAQMFEAVGTAQVIALEVHNPAAFENAFRIPSLHLEARHVLGRAVAPLVAGAVSIVVASPDPGGAKRAQLWSDELEAELGRPVGFAMVDKRRSDDVVSGAQAIAGEVAGATVLLFDDLIATGETLQRAAQALRRAGANAIVACAAHGLFVGRAAEALADDAIERVFVTDSVPAFRLGTEERARVDVVSCAPLFAAAIRDSHATWAGSPLDA